MRRVLLAALAFAIAGNGVPAVPALQEKPEGKTGLDLEKLAPEDVVIVDGKEIGQGQTFAAVAPGTREIVVRRPGHPAARTLLELAAGEVVPLAVPGWSPAPPAKPLPISPKAAAAVEAGLEWLREHQSPEGFWDPAGFARICGHEACRGGGAPAHAPGVSGLALLAFLHAGETDDTPRFGDPVRRGLRWLLGIQMSGGAFGDLPSTHNCYDQAIATLVMATAARRTGDPRYRKAAEEGARFILRDQVPNRGWRYYDKVKEDTDTSVTGWSVLAVTAAAAEGGEPLSPAAISGIENWFRLVTEPEYGRVGYTAMGNGPSRSQEDLDAFPPDRSESMTALALCARLAIGTDPKTDDLWKRGKDLLGKCLPRWAPEAGSIDLYYWMFGSRAMAAAGGKEAEAWRTALEAALLPHQLPDKRGHGRGSWDPRDPWRESTGRVGTTAMALLALEAPAIAAPFRAPAGPRTTLKATTQPPGAAVFLRGRHLGATPFDGEVIAGAATLALHAPEKGAAVSAIRLRPFAANEAPPVVLSPGATVEVGGEIAVPLLLGEGRVLPRKAVLRSGRFRGLLAKPGSWTQVVERELEAGGTAVLQAAPWEAAPAWAEAAAPDLVAPPRPGPLPGVLPPGFREEGGRIWCLKDRAEMVVVPASPGRFLLVDRHEVTVGQHGRFHTERQGAPPVRKGKWRNLDPVLGLRPDEARAYAAWAGKRLPTEAEWTAFAGEPVVEAGGVAWPFPWGLFDSLEARNLEGKRDGVDGIAEVGRFPAGMTSRGLLDVVGNARELCADGVVQGTGIAADAVGFRCVADLLPAAGGGPR